MQIQIHADSSDLVSVAPSLRILSQTDRTHIGYRQLLVKVSHKMLSDPVQAYRSQHALYDAHFEATLAEDGKVRFLFPHALAPFFVLFLALMIRYPSTGPLKYLRYVSAGALCYVTYINLVTIRTTNFGTGFGLGMLWMVLLLNGIAFFACNDHVRNFKRIQKVPIPASTTEERTDHTERSGTDTKTPVRYAYRWQSFPDSLKERSIWCLDLICSPRGAGWNWRIVSMPPLPKEVSLELEGKREIEEKTLASAHPFGLDAAKRRLREVCVRFLIEYMVIDILKTAIQYDPYFWGIVDAPPVWPFELLPPTIANVFAHGTRAYLTATGILIILNLYAHFMTLVYLSIGLLLKGSPIFSEPWMHAELNGPLLSTAMEYSVGGLWSIWWHQLCQIALITIPQWIVRPFPRSSFKRFSYVILAFMMSGFIHAVGTYTMAAPTSPLSMFMFFLLQAAYICMHNIFAKHILPKCNLDLSIRTRQIANAFFAFVWFYLTGPLFADVMASGGIWLSEPLPLSPTRALGLGFDATEGFVRNTGYNLFRWYSGDKWWQKGIIIL